ncbi:WD40 repeat domain-containing protein [Sporobolomyces salmoneus]|uniref:WD40 repeat domain-containing protein n=1 Tax=Sporobolomyces salmoneus TaxID=183962 RepID=UPI00317AC66E
MSIGNLPENSWFAAPEGVYTLIYSANPTLNIAPNAFTGPSSVPQPSTSSPTTTLGTLAEQPPSAPPVYPSKLAVVSVRFLTREGGEGKGNGFGMSMGRRTNPTAAAGGGGDNATESVTEPIPIVGTSGNGGNGEGRGTIGSTSSMSNLSPTTKRRPLTSSFSMLGGLNTFGTTGTAGGGGGDSTTSTSPNTTSRPNRALKGTTSSFIRSWEGLPLSQMQLKMISEANAGKETIFGFQTMSKGVFWSEIAKGKKDPLSRIIFSAFPTCIDVNQHTASHTQIDLLIGFATGDIVWIDPLTAKYTRLNKSGVITSSPVTSISWLAPVSSSSDTASLPSQTSSALPENRSNLFLTSHADGTVLIWDKDREDWNGFVPKDPTVAPRNGNGSVASGKENEWRSDPRVAHGEEGKAVLGKEELVVSKPPATDKKGQTCAGKFNPVSHWKVSKQGINAFAVSPDQQFCATVGEDGCLRIIDLAEEKLLDSYASYFGSLTCVSWSPDGRFVVTGGQDDLLTVYAPHEQHIVAQCPGHTSWVTRVAFDPERTEDRTMRFVSIGEDCKLILWDLSSAALTRPKAHIHSHHRRHSASSQLSLHRRSTSEQSSSHLPLSASERDGPVFHPPPRRDDCSVLQPIMLKTLSNDILSSLALLPEFIVLGSRGGQVSQYDRPPTGDLSGLNDEFAASVVRIDARAR